MTGLSGITNKILEEARIKADEIILSAKKQAQEIIDSANSEMAKEEEQKLAFAKRDAELRAQRIVASAQLEAKKEVLAKKQQIIDEVFDKAKYYLATLDDEKYNLLIEKMSKNVKGEIILLPRDKEKGTGGGFIAKDGRVEYNFSFETLLKNAKERLTIELAEIIFSE